MTVLGGVVLAAGFSRRMGRDKLGLPWPGPSGNTPGIVLDGVPGTGPVAGPDAGLHAALAPGVSGGAPGSGASGPGAPGSGTPGTVLDAVLAAAAVLPVGVLVGGPEGTALPPGWTRVDSPERALGQAASLRAGLAALPPGLDGAMVLLGDMPLVTPGLVRRLMAAFRPGRFLVPACGGMRGNPVCIPAASFAQVMELTGDTGARPLLAASPGLVDVLEVGDPAVLDDLDTPEDYSRLTNQPSCAEP